MSTYDDDDFLVGEEADELFADQPEAETAGSIVVAKGRPAVEEAFTILAEALRRNQMPNDLMQELANLIPTELFDIAPIEADFDMKQELAEQQALVTSMRKGIMNPGGKGLKANVSISEAKATMDACRQFSETIRKNLESYVNLERIQALESAVLETVNGYPEDFKREFCVNLKKALDFHCKQ